jgi:hypothetical protein
MAEGHKHHIKCFDGLILHTKELSSKPFDLSQVQPRTSSRAKPNSKKAPKTEDIQYWGP